MRRFRPTCGARLRRAVTSACLTAVLCAFGAGAVARAADPVPTALPATPGSEAEPNDLLANASEIASGERVRGSVYPAGDVDRYRFTAESGDRVFATVMTNGSAGNATDSQLRLLSADGTEIEFEDDNGSLPGLSSSLAGAAIPAAGTYYLDVRGFQPSDTIRPYDLLLDVRAGAPVAEAEPNDGPEGANPLDGGIVAGVRTAADQDWYALELVAGDTVFLSLDLDPERDGTTFNGRLGFGPTADGLVTVDDPGTADDIDSEAYVATVRAAGTYYVRVDSADAAAGTAYQVSGTVIPAVQRSCRTYAVAPSAGTIPDQGAVTFPIEVADAATIDHVAVALDVTHARMSDLDVTLQAPTGNQIALVTDIGSLAPNSPTRMQVLFDDDAGAAPHSPALTWPSLQLESSARLSYFSGQPATGTWNLTLYDDLPGSTGTLSRAELVLCARPEEGPAETIFSAGFESGDDGFTHSGTAVEWERGLPATQQAPGEFSTVVAGVASCGEGTACFKTDLDGPYDPNSSQDLVSPPISLAGRTGTVYASWAMWYQLETANFDHATVTVEEDGGADPRPLFTWLGANMSQPVGVGGSAQILPFVAGWGVHRADISAYAGRTIRLRFHLDSDNLVQFAGLAVDDVRVYQPLFALDVAIAGSGSGYVDSSPAGIDCGTDTAAHPKCSVTRAGSVTLTAHPNTDSSFAGFTGGGCSGAAPTCTVSLDQARSVTARFDLRPHAPTLPPPGAAPTSAEPAISRLWLPSRCLRRSRSGRVRIRMIMRLARPGPLQIRIDRAVRSTNRRSCPQPNPARRRTTRYERVTTVRSAPTGAVAASVTRQTTLHLRLRPGLYRLTVRAYVDGGRLSPPLRRFLRVLG